MRIFININLPMLPLGDSVSNCTRFDNDEHFEEVSDYEWIKAMRDIIIFISAIALILNIILIISSNNCLI